MVMKAASEKSITKTLTMANPKKISSSPPPQGVRISSGTFASGGAGGGSGAVNCGTAGDSDWGAAESSGGIGICESEKVIGLACGAEDEMCATRAKFRWQRRARRLRQERRREAA